jgi:hypothetical protein
MSSAQAEPFPIAVVRAPKTEEGFITFAWAVYNGFNGNTTFPAPDPTMPIFNDHITQLQASQTKALGRGKGTSTARNAKKALVKADLKCLCAYVQRVIPTLASPADARAAITSVFLSIKKAATRHKPPLAAKNASVSGTVTLVAKSVGPNSTYYWEYSVDGKTWIKAPDTLKGKTTISGLTPATTYYFRFRALTRKGPVDYSQVVSLLAH